MHRRPPGSTLTDILCPYTTLFLSIHVIMRCEHMVRARHAQSIMCACVDQLIGKARVAPLRQAREERDIGGKTIGRIQRSLAAEEARRLFLQRFLLGRIAAHQASTDRKSVRAGKSVAVRGYLGCLRMLKK